MKIAIWGACREGVDCLRSIKGSRLFEDDLYYFIDNDRRVTGSHLESCEIHHSSALLDLNVDLIVIGIIDTEVVIKQINDLKFKGLVKKFYGDQYFANRSRKIGMAEVGAYSYFKPSTFLYNVKIGSYCHIGADCRLGLIGHDPTNLTTYPLKLKSHNYEFAWEGEAPKRVSPLIIEDDVYIGEGVSIMAGITIGRGSVIGSKSLVTNNVDPFSVVAGVPARKISDRLDADLIRKLHDSGWTGFGIDEAIEQLSLIAETSNKFIIKK